MESLRKYFGANGTNKNDIFPNKIPDSAKVEKFCYHYYNPFEPKYLSYLVYSCNEEDFGKETDRFAGLHSSENALVYGETGFRYPVGAVYADDYKGYLYALTDQENHRLIYVEINFCNYFCDIKYEDVIDQKYLPVNFNAKIGNPRYLKFQREFEQGQSGYPNAKRQLF